MDLALVCLTYSGPLDGFMERTFPVQGPFRDAIYAPPPEDGMKLLGVILIAGVVPHILRRPMGAVVVGLLVGLGFSFTENWFMSNALIAAGDASRLPGLMLARATVGAWSHSVFAAVAAVGVWYVLARPNGACCTGCLWLSPGSSPSPPLPLHKVRDHTESTARQYGQAATPPTTSPSSRPTRSSRSSRSSFWWH